MNSRLASAAGVISTIIIALSQIAQFRISVHVIGLDILGIWIILQTIFFLARLSESGVGINITRSFSSTYGESKSLYISYLCASSILVIPPVILIGLIITPFADIYINSDLERYSNSTSSMILTLGAFGVSLIGAIAGSLLSVVEGGGHLVRRHILNACGALISVVLSWPLLTYFGVYGLALSAAIQSLFIVILCMYFIITRYWMLPRNSEVLQIVKAIWIECLNSSTMAILRAGYEPWTKFAVGTFSAPAHVATVDLAFKIATQIRVLVQSAAQPLLFIGSRSNYKEETILKTFSIATELISRANWALISTIFISAHFLIYTGLGVLSDFGSLSLILLATGNSINSVGVTGYYWQASRGVMMPLVKIHFYMLLANIILSLTLGYFFGAIGCVVAYVFSFILGGYLLLGIWSKAIDQPFYRPLFPTFGNLLLFISSVIFILGFSTNLNNNSQVVWSFFGGVAVSAVALMINFRYFSLVWKGR